MNSYEDITNYEEDGSTLTLDPSVILEKRQGGRSVTDGHGIRVFTDEFYTRMSDYKKTLDRNAVGDRVFVDRMSDNSGIQLEEFMFREPMAATGHDYDIAKGDRTSSFYVWVIGVMFICFAVFLYRYLKNGGRVRDYYDNPENGKIQEKHGYTGE